MTMATKLVHVVLLFSAMMEFNRGVLHFFWPMESHLVISHLVDAFEIRDSYNAVAPLYLVTYQFGCANMLLGFMYMGPLIWHDNTMLFSLYTLSTTTLFRVIQESNKFIPVTTDLMTSLVVPNTITAPGKAAQMIQLPILIIGFIAAVISFRERRTELNEKGNAVAITSRGDC